MCQTCLTRHLERANSKQEQELQQTSCSVLKIHGSWNDLLSFLRTASICNSNKKMYVQFKEEHMYKSTFFTNLFLRLHFIYVPLRALLTVKHSTEAINMRMKMLYPYRVLSPLSDPSSFCLFFVLNINNIYS
jgi:hypothetical protein